MIDIEKFICSLLADHPVGVTVREDIHKALKDQGLEYIGGKIVPTALQENEDERMWLIKYLQEEIDCLHFDIRDDEDRIKLKNLQSSLAWLEKQGEHQKFRDSIQVGDKVTRNKDGVLVNLSQLNRVAKKQGEQKPAYTKEYDFHGIKFIPKFAKGDIIKDKKRGEVSTIKDFSYDTGLYTHTYGQFPITIQDNYEIIAQNSTWSERDEKIYSRICDLIHSAAYKNYDVDEDGNECGEYANIKGWFKKLKGRVQPQPNKAWSKEDDEMMQYVIDSIDTRISDLNLSNIRTWFKSLKQRYTWKPSDEQIEALIWQVNNTYKGSWQYEATKELLEQLKKIKG